MLCARLDVESRVKALFPITKVGKPSIRIRRGYWLRRRDRYYLQIVNNFV